MSQIETGFRRMLASPLIYDFFQDLVGAPALRIRLVRECLRPFPRARILDIGCGTGDLLRYLPPGIDYSGFDMDPGYIASARRRFGGPGRFTCGTVDAFAASAEAGPGPGADETERAGNDAKYDIAVAFGVLHHLEDGEARRLFQSARRALRPGGRLVAIDPARVPDQAYLARYLVSRDRGRNVRSPEEYAALARGPFQAVEASVWHNALRVPFDHAVLVCLA